VPAAGKCRCADRAVDDTLPESPQRIGAAPFLCGSRAKTAHQRREVADARRQQRFDALAQPPRQHRRGAAGPDRDHNLAAVDNGRKNESRQVGPVDDIDRNSLPPRLRGDRIVALIAEGRDDGNQAGEVRLLRIGSRNLDPSGPQLGGEIGFDGAGAFSEPAHAGACRP
jgi:hypothetical protein